MDKQQLRKTMEVTRQTISEQHGMAGSEAICRHALELLSPLMHPTRKPMLFTFMPFRREVDVTYLTRWWWEAGCRVAIPKVHTKSQTMEAYEIHNFEELEPGAWGIPEPQVTTSHHVPYREIDIIIIPGLAYDRHGGRLGYGSGYYDRFIAAYDECGLPHPLKLGLCFETQLLDELPMEQHDLRVDRIVTEQGVYDILPLKSS